MTSFKLGMAAMASIAALDCGGVAAAQDDIQTLEPIEVWGDRGAGDPGSVSVLDVDAIADLSSDHPAEVLNTLPGVNIQMNSGQEHLIAVRSPVLTGGAGQGSFLILENGVPVRSPAFGNVNSLLEPHHEVAGSIEVVRGPGSAKYGSNAVHGLINVILPSVRVGQDAVTVTGSTLGRYKADVSASGEASTFSVSLQDETGWRDNTGLFQLKASALTEFSFGAWDATAWVSGSYLEQETAGFIQGPDAYQDRDLAKSNPNPEAYRDAWSARAAMRLEREMGDGVIVFKPFLRIQQMDFRQHFLPYSGFEKNGHTGGGLMARYEQPLSDTIEWRLGSDVDVASGYLRETQDRPTFGFNPANDQFPQGLHYDYTVDTAMGAIWSELDWAVNDRLTVLAGLRAEAHEYDYTTDAQVGINGRFNVPGDRTDEFSFVTPKLGATYQLDDGVTLYANYARGSRAPQASDLYRLQSLQGVAEADVETLDSLELGARGSVFGDALVFDVAAYWMDKENFFFRDSNGLNVTDGSTRHQGIEFASDWTLSDTISLRGAAAWSDQTYTFDRTVNSASETIADGNVVDTAPEWLADLTLTWTPTDRLEASLSAEHIGEYFTNPANTQSYPGHTVFHLRTGYDFGEQLRAFIIIRNLFDETYADRADFAFGNERYFPGEPLNATVGLRKAF